MFPPALSSWTSTTVFFHSTLYLTLYLSFTQGAIPSQSLVSISDSSSPNSPELCAAAAAWVAGLSSVLTLRQVHMELVNE